MAYKRKSKTKRTRRTTKKTTRRRLPQGFTRQGKSYSLVFGTKAKPRLSKKKFKTKSALTKYVLKTYGKKKRK